MSKFFIFGLQRSGTTFLEKIITNNFDVAVANKEGSWKHSLDVPETIGLYQSYCVFKNPYTWLESIIFRDPADLLVTASKRYRLTNEGYVIGHDSVNLIELCRLYNNYVSTWAESGACIVRYEDLLVNDTLTSLLSKIPFTRKTSETIVPPPGSLFMSEGFQMSRYSYYLGQKPEKFSSDELALINANIETKNLKKIGYRQITTKAL